MEKHLKLCLVTHRGEIPFLQYKSFIHSILDSGVTAIQLREKNTSLVEITQIAFELKELLNPYKIPLIINDHVTVAKEVDAEGVHLGQADTDVTTARNILGPNKIIGVSIESLDDLNKANSTKSIDYVAASAVFKSTTKTNCKTIWGLEGLQFLVQNSKHPVVAIGGINLTNVQTVMQCGPVGVALISEIHDSKHPKITMRKLLNIINEE